MGLFLFVIIIIVVWTKFRLNFETVLHCHGCCLWYEWAISLTELVFCSIFH